MTPQLLKVGSLYIKKTNGGEAWNNVASDVGGSCSQTINAKLDSLREWEAGGRGGQKDHGLWHLLTSCFDSGTIGLAYKGVLCADRGYNTGVSGFSQGGRGCCADWATFAHEASHIS